MPSEMNNAIWSMDRDHVIHPYANYLHFPKKGSVVFDRAERHTITDADGKSYLDAMAGLWCVNLGHGHPALVETIAAQAARLAYFNTFEDATSAPAAQLAHKLAQLAPGTLNHTFFSTGGSMANDTAIKMVHYYFNQCGLPEKKLVISRNLGYHGSTFLAHTLTGIRVTHAGFDIAKGLVHYVSAPYAYRYGHGMDDEAFLDYLTAEFESMILSLGPNRVAAFIAEPIMGAGGVIVPPEGYHRAMWEICQRYGLLYIADEVVTGFGRLGAMITSETLFGYTPDILVLAKGISSGYVPLGATMVSDEIHDVIARPKDDNPSFSHGFTYSGHPLACAVGLKNIELLEEERWCEHVQTWGPYFETELFTLADHPLVGEARGSHYMLCLELVRDKRSKAGFDPSVEIAKRVYFHAKERGLMMRPIGPLCVFSPPLTFDQAAIDETVEIVHQSLDATLSDLKREGILTKSVAVPSPALTS